MKLGALNAKTACHSVRACVKERNVRACVQACCLMNVFEWECVLIHFWFDHYIMHLGSVWRRYRFAQWTSFQVHMIQDCFKCAIQTTITIRWVALSGANSTVAEQWTSINRQSRSMHKERPDSAWSKEFYPAQLYCRSSWIWKKNSKSSSMSPFRLVLIEPALLLPVRRPLSIETEARGLPQWNAMSWNKQIYIYIKKDKHSICCTLEQVYILNCVYLCKWSLYHRKSIC